jgi:hypothetical protein
LNDVPLDELKLLRLPNVNEFEPYLSIHSNYYYQKSLNGQNFNRFKTSNKTYNPIDLTKTLVIHMKFADACNLGEIINQRCFHNQATFGNDNDKDIAPIPFKKNPELPFTERNFGVRIRKIKANKAVRESLELFIGEINKQNEGMYLRIDESKKEYLVIHDQR